jgi:transcription elongation factor
MSAKLEVGDRICVVLGTYRLLSGRINNICGNNTITFECDNFESYGVVQVFIWEVVRVFDLGDHVEVHCSEHRGVEGFIISKDDVSILLYVSEGQKQQQVACEVNNQMNYNLITIT